MTDPKVVDIVIGDPTDIPIRLLENGAFFDMSTATSVRAALVDRFNENIIIPAITLISTDPGNDWANSLILVNFTDVQTALITEQTTYYLEIEVVDTDTFTVFVPVRARRGLIS